MWGEKIMNYYAVFLTMKDPEKSQQFRGEHLDFLEEMRGKNHVFLYGRLLDGAGGLIIYQGESLSKVEALVKEDPYVKLEARGYEIHEWDMKTDYTFTK
jgi:uncharacterized protein YciI